MEGCPVRFRAIRRLDCSARGIALVPCRSSGLSGRLAVSWTRMCMLHAARTVYSNSYRPAQDVFHPGSPGSSLHKSGDRDGLELRRLQEF